MTTHALFKAFMIVLGLSGMALAQNPPCYKYKTQVVQLTGTMKRHRFAGPPNYESVKNGDALEIYWLLHLSTPICAEPSDPSEEFDDPHSGVSALQILIRDYKRYRPLLGKQVKITGTLFSAITGHHHTPVLIDAREIEKAP